MNSRRTSCRKSSKHTPEALKTHTMITAVWIALGLTTLLHITQQYVEVERGENEDLHYVNFKEFFHYVLNISQVLATIEVQDYFECAFGCLTNKACFSFNFAVVPDNKTGRHVCHLLATDKYSHSSGFLLSQEFHHYAISSPCESFPCQNSGTCRPLYEKNDFECHCRERNTGKYCDGCTPPWAIYGGSCYALYTAAESWSNADATCKKNGAQLVKIESAGENDFIKREFLTEEEHYWIGLTDSAKEGDWKWTDGTGLTGYTNWRSSEPNNANGEDCGEIKMGKYGKKYYDAEWNDLDCSLHLSFICEK